MKDLTISRLNPLKERQFKMFNMVSEKIKNLIMSNMEFLMQLIPLPYVLTSNFFIYWKNTVDARE